MSQGSLGTRVKDPADIRTYAIDWSAWLTSQTNDTISSSTWSLPTGVTDVLDSSTTTTATVKISGGTNGHVYACTNTIVTAGGQTKRVSFYLQVETQ